MAVRRAVLTLALAGCAAGGSDPGPGAPAGALQSIVFRVPTGELGLRQSPGIPGWNLGTSAAAGNHAGVPVRYKFSGSAPGSRVAVHLEEASAAVDAGVFEWTFTPAVNVVQVPGAVVGVLLGIDIPRPKDSEVVFPVPVGADLEMTGMGQSVNAPPYAASGSLDATVTLSVLP